MNNIGKLLSLLTVRQVIEAGPEYIEAAGLNPWCIAEGRATGDEPAVAWWKFEEPCAARYDFDGYGWKYVDSGSGSDWKTRYSNYPDFEFIYSRS